MKYPFLLTFALLAMLLGACQGAKSGSLPATTPTATKSVAAATQTANPASQAGLPTPTPTANLPVLTPTTDESSPVATQTAPANPPTLTATQSAPAASPPATQPTPTRACTDRATFEADVTVPDDTLFQPGEKFTKTWRLYNSGDCAWDQGYQVSFAYGDAMDAALSSPLPATAPGASVNISLDMTAPASAGQHAGNWQLQNAAGEHFGVGQNGQDYFWVQVAVSFAGAVTSAPGNSAPASGNNPATTPGGCAYNSDPQAEAEILQQINTIRTMHGLNALTRQPQLDAAARTYSLDMACNNRVDFTRHTDSQGGRWYERIAAQGYAYSKAFENVYSGNPAYGGTAQTAMNWWMNSPIHRDNILNPDVSEIGIAYAYTDTSDYGGYYTVDFAAP